jgi:hypothetical protein
VVGWSAEGYTNEGALAGAVSAEQIFRICGLSWLTIDALLGTDLSVMGGHDAQRVHQSSRTCLSTSPR